MQDEPVRSTSHRHQWVWHLPMSAICREEMKKKNEEITTRIFIFCIKRKITLYFFFCILELCSFYVITMHTIHQWRIQFIRKHTQHTFLRLIPWTQHTVVSFTLTRSMHLCTFTAFIVMPLLHTIYLILWLFPLWFSFPDKFNFIFGFSEVCSSLASKQIHTKIIFQMHSVGSFDWKTATYNEFSEFYFITVKLFTDKNTHFPNKNCMKMTLNYAYRISLTF